MRHSGLASLSLAFFLCGLAAAQGHAFDLSEAHSGNDAAFDEAYQARKAERARIMEEQKRRQAEHFANRDRSKDACYQLELGSDAQLACFGEYPASVRNERARNILMGYCSSLGSDKFAQQLSWVCNNGFEGCAVFGNSEARYQCQQCGGTKSWLATYSLGYLIKCYH